MVERAERILDRARTLDGQQVVEEFLLARQMIADPFFRRRAIEPTDPDMKRIALRAALRHRTQNQAGGNNREKRTADALLADSEREARNEWTRHRNLLNSHGDALGECSPQP